VHTPATTHEEDTKGTVLKASKELLKCARVDLYSITQDQNEMIWHDVDMAATQNLSQSPDLVLKLEGLVGHALS
jgi:hypothetical protein